MTRIVDIAPRISFNPDVMQGQACIRGTRVTVATIVETLAEVHSKEELLSAYPYLDLEDIDEALRFASIKLHEAEYELLPA